MGTKKMGPGRKQRTMYVAISRGVQVAARTRAIEETTTLSEIVERALRMYLATTSNTGERS